MLKPVTLSIALFSLAFSIPGSFAQVSCGSTPRSAARFLEQATWGPDPQTISDLQATGCAGWLSKQFALNTSDLPDQPLLDSNGNANTNLGPVQAAFYVNNVTGQDQLRQRVAFALSEMWVVSTEAVTNAYAYPPYWRVLRDNAFGNYRDIITAVTLNPAMGKYLSMANNNKATTSSTSANENYARELMQLFTIGLTQLNIDGSPVLDSAGNPVPTYTQAIVTSTAKALTGWTYPLTPGATAKSNNPAYFFGQMYAVESEHDSTSKTVVGNVTIPAGQSAEKDLTSLVNAIMAQPTMAPFVCTQLIQHLVTSNPSPDYIKRVSTVFNNNGSGVKGDMQAVITAILMDPEARAGDDPSLPVNASFGHLREPILMLSHILRGLGATIDSTNTVNGVASAMGQNLFNQGSVFSYFSPFYSIGPNLLGPEFQLYTTQTASTTADYLYNVTYGGSLGGSKVGLTEFTQYSKDLPSLLNEIDLVFTHSSMSPALRQQAMNAAAAASTPAHAVAAALYIVLTSGEYSVIH
jgi:uncharacterized protein (DUF1800 family)